VLAIITHSLQKITALAALNVRRIQPRLAQQKNALLVTALQHAARRLSN
jgi:hypothetical protein